MRFAPLTRASTEMTIGELRQLAVTSPMTFSEQDYFDFALIRFRKDRGPHLSAA
jgi:hypothetical protein